MDARAQPLWLASLTNSLLAKRALAALLHRGCNAADADMAASQSHGCTCSLSPWPRIYVSSCAESSRVRHVQADISVLLICVELRHWSALEHVVQLAEVLHLLRP